MTDALTIVTRQRDALARVLLQVETQEHNRAVLAAGVDLLDYTHGMEAAAIAADRVHLAAFDPTPADLDADTEREIARRDDAEPIAEQEGGA